MKLTGLIAVERIRDAINSLYDDLPSIATQSEAEAGTNNAKMMTPLRTKQAITKLSPVKTVNGVSPDSSGNITVETGSSVMLKVW